MNKSKKLKKLAGAAAIFALASGIIGPALTIGGLIKKATFCDSKIQTLIDDYRNQRIESVLSDSETAEIEKALYSKMSDDALIEDIRENSDKVSRQKLTEYEKEFESTKALCFAGCGIMGASAASVLVSAASHLAADKEENEIEVY